MNQHRDDYDKPLADAVQRQREIWEREAPRYDRQMGVWERVLFDDARAWVCSQAVGDVLDVAIGTGRNLPSYPAGICLTGLDLSPAMLDIARNRARELRLTVKLDEGDAHVLPYDDASFDSVVCTFSLCNIPDHRLAISEMHRVLRPGGRLLLADHVGSSSRLLLAVQRTLEKLTLRFGGETLTRRQLPLVVEAGFTIENERRSKKGIVELVAARKHAQSPSEQSLDES